MRLRLRVGFLAAGWALFFAQAGCRLVMEIPDGPPTPAECGDGVRAGDEACDGTDLAGETCETLEFSGGTLACAEECEFDTSGCVQTSCGNGVVDAQTEACDGTDLDGETCESLGFTGGTLSCSTGCEFDTTGCTQLSCGNGVIDAQLEECDGADLGGATCETLGYQGGGTLACAGNCLLDDSACLSQCGNEVIEPGESCDPGSRPHPGCSFDCQVNAGWECTGEPSVCVSTCGDGIITSAEDCEGADLNGQNCTTYGLGYGPLACGDDCIFDTSACHQVESVSAGDRHTCAILVGGAAYCWGDGDAGQLGQGNHAESNVPVRIGFADPARGIAAAASHTCAITIDSGFTRHLHCWGDNASGQLGIGSSLASTSPVHVSDPSSFLDDVLVSAHGDYTCAAVLDGNAFCWGANFDGQLGTGNYTSYQTPRQVQDLTNVTALATGLNHTCAIGGPSLYCWGGNGFGQLGIGTTGSPRNRPEYVSVTNGARSVAVGTYFTCAVSYSSHPHCWGQNTYGQLGNGNTTNQMSPTLVSGLTDVAGIALGAYHACALLNDGTVRCWGSNMFGQLGDGTANNSTVPVTVSGLSGITALSAGAGHTCALRNDGTLWCWGTNLFGQLGDQSNVDSLVPVLVRF